MSRPWAIIVTVFILVAGCKKSASEAIKPQAAAPPTMPATQNGVTTEGQLESKVFQIVAEQAGVRTSEIKLATQFRRDLKFDELDDVELVMELEDTFNLTIADAEAERFQSVGQVVKYVQNHYRPGVPVHRMRAATRPMQK